MKKHKKFQDILDECLERLLHKGESIEACLKDYPSEADELEPLLQMMMAAKEASALEPRPDFKARARYQFQAKLSELGTKKGFALFNWRSRWATVMITVLVLIFASGGTVAAASGSMPDETLYPVKLATEAAWLKLTPSDAGKAEVYIRLADRRIREIVNMAAKGNTQQVDKTTELLDAHLVGIPGLILSVEEPQMLVEAPPLPSEAPRAGGAEEGATVKPAVRTKLGATLLRNSVRHQEALRSALDKSPAKAKSALRRAIRVLEGGYKKALQAAED